MVSMEMLENNEGLRKRSTSSPKIGYEDKLNSIQYEEIELIGFSLLNKTFESVYAASEREKPSQPPIVASSSEYETAL